MPKSIDGTAFDEMVVLHRLAVALLLRHLPFRSETARALPGIDEPAAGTEDAFEPSPAAGPLGRVSEEGDASLFSGADDLSPEDEDRLLEWLRREQARWTGGPA